MASNILIILVQSLKKNAKRHSGGIIIYFKECYREFISLVSLDNKGIILFKLSKDMSCSSKDSYFCLCYIPPEDSNVYRNINSPLYDFDFFEKLNSDIRKYRDYGNVYLNGDLNSRTGELLDYIPDLHLGRFVNLPMNDNLASSLPVRRNCDKQVNPFGAKLLTICKEKMIYVY
jgi:hypothetical protein